jgi:hypothetical protein
LLLASLGGKRHVDAGGIEEAWSDLQQLPAPWREREPQTTPTAVVEFGELSEDAAPAASSISRAEKQLEAVESTLSYFASESTAGEDSLDRSLSMDESPEAVSFVGSQAMESVRSSRLIQPEIELYFHAPHDPFGEVFEEEEVVIDRYASLEDDAGRGRTRVSSAESREIASALTSSPAYATAKSPQVEFGAQVDLDAADHSAEPVVSREFETPLAFAAVELPTYDASVVARSSESSAPLDLDDGADDRDLIRIEDLDQSSLPAGRGRVRRQEYKQLFARLRSSQSS